MKKSKLLETEDCTVTTVHFTIPNRYSQEPHPFGCKPEDWFDVHVPDHVLDPEGWARQHVNDVYGPLIWCSTEVDGVRWDTSRAKYYPGMCRKVIHV